MNPVIVVGGGIAGLATAYELHRRSMPFVVLESSARPGGVIFSERIDNEYTVDAGPDSLLVQKPDGIRLCQELGLGDRLIETKPPRLAYIQRSKVLHPLPANSVLGIPTRFGPFVTTRLFSWSGKIRMAAEIFVPPKHDARDESIGSFMRRRFGQEMVEYLAEPLLAGIHAGDVDRLSIDALFPRFVEAERRHGSVLRAFRHLPQRPAGEAASAFRSLPGGLIELVDALMKALPKNSVRLNSPVLAIHKERDGSQRQGDGSQRQRDGSLEPASCYTVQTREEELRADAVILATPAYVTAKIVRDLDGRLADLCSQISYASTATVAMAFPRAAIKHPLNGSGFVVPRRERTGILAASWLSSKWPDRAPENCALIRTFVGGARDPQALERSDQELVATSRGALADVIGLSGAPLFTRVYRWGRASAQHDVGHLARMQEIDHALAYHPNLFVTGSGFRGVGIPDCVADARATASRVSACVQLPVHH